MKKTLRPTLIEMFEKVNKVKLNENLDIVKLTEGNQPVQLDQKGQAVLKAINTMSSQYVNRFIGDILGIDSNWKTLTQYTERVADIIAKSPKEKFASVIAKYPLVQKNLQNVL